MNETIKKIVTIVAQVTGKTEEDLTGRLEEEGLWDSFNKVEIVFAIEDEFGVKLNGDMIKSFNTVGDIVALMNK